MRTTNIKYARDNLRALIDNEVARGEEVVVTRRGEPVARLAPIERKRRQLPSLSEFRSSIRVEGRPLSEELIAAREEERY